MAAVMIYMTAGSQDEAQTIARQMVGERLAACANILAGVRSIYRWEGEVHDDPEVVVVMKTTAAKVALLTERIRTLHSYDCPCVVSVPIEGGNPEFFDWITQETS